jgi:hypothetical protein
LVVFRRRFQAFQRKLRDRLDLQGVGQTILHEPRSSPRSRYQNRRRIFSFAPEITR